MLIQRVIFLTGWYTKLKKKFTQRRTILAFIHQRTALKKMISSEPNINNRILLEMLEQLVLFKIPSYRQTSMALLNTK